MTVDWRKPVRFTIEGDVDSWERSATFLGHHDCRVFVHPGAWIDVGAGSLLSVRHIAVQSRFEGYAGSVGRYCEISSPIWVGAEHANHLPVNIGFSQAGAHRAAGGDGLGLKPAIPARIGSGVVISHGVNVLDGVSVGDGAVIGAGAVLTRDAEPFGIYAGVPARKIGERMDPERRALVQKVRWWDFHPLYMIENMARLQELALQDADHPRLEERPRLALALDGTGPRFLGVSDGDKVVPAPSKVQAYAEQALGPGPYTWVADIWAE